MARHTLTSSHKFNSRDTETSSIFTSFIKSLRCRLCASYVEKADFANLYGRVRNAYTVGHYAVLGVEQLMCVVQSL